MDRQSTRPPCSCNQPDTSFNELSKQPVYQYQELITPLSIRIFELLPGKDGDPIRGNLKQIQLDDDADTYYALSYAWEDTRNTHLVECDGCSLQINCSLFSSLTRLRDTEQQNSLQLFVDAISINQCVEPNALQEGETQVKLMNEVYGLADTVVIDLGHDIYDPNAAFTYLMKLATLSDDSWEKVWTEQNGCSEVELPPLNAAAWDSIASFCSSKWFSRLWVL